MGDTKLLIVPEEIKSLFRKNSIRKNIRIHFPNGEREDITNSNLLSESFSFTESIMSQSEFKFGLCEASMVEFQCFEIENIKDCIIEVSHEIDISSLGEEFISEHGIVSDDVQFPFYRIPYGRFFVDTCKRQSDMIKRKVTAFSQDLLDEKINNPVENAKFNQIINCRYQSPYNFNTNAFMYVNLFKDYDPNLFSEKEIASFDGNTTIYTSNYNSEETITNSNGENVIPKYVMEISVSAKRKIFYEENNNLICELTYSDLNELYYNELYSVINELNKNYGFFDEKSATKIIESIKKHMKNVCFKTIDSEVNLNGYHYIYPYVGYSSVEINALKETRGYLYELLLPYRVFVKISKYQYLENNFVNSYEIYSKIIEYRNEDEFICNFITNINEFYMSVPRIFFQIGENKVYSISQKLEIRNLIESAIEFNGCFGKYGRNGKFNFIKLNNNLGVYPSEELYPVETLYPSEPSGGTFTKENYLSAWYDEEYKKPYSRVIVAYKNTDLEDITDEYWLVDTETEDYDKNLYQEYSLSENYLIKNGTFTELQIKEILQTVGEALKNIKYMPCEIRATGMPWIEAGDSLVVLTNDGGFETLVLNRKIDGIQGLKDNITAD